VRLCALQLEVRKSLPGMNPQRADILPAGLLIIDVVLQRTEHEQALVSTNDLLLGTLLLSRRRA
jgi:exopolyphosphatase/guanosine-5'-triphosphate,3'-diphosphate pyrophosphatase